MVNNPDRRRQCKALLQKYLENVAIPFVQEYNKLPHSRGQRVVDALVNSDINLEEFHRIVVMIKNVKLDPAFASEARLKSAQRGLLYNDALPRTRAHFKNTLVLLVAFWHAARDYLKGTLLAEDVTAWLMYVIWHYELKIIQANVFNVQHNARVLQVVKRNVKQKLLNGARLGTCHLCHQRQFLVLLWKVYRQCNLALNGSGTDEGQGKNYE